MESVADPASVVEEPRTWPLNHLRDGVEQLYPSSPDVTPGRITGSLTVRVLSTTAKHEKDGESGDQHSSPPHRREIRTDAATESESQPQHGRDRPRDRRNRHYSRRSTAHA